MIFKSSNLEGLKSELENNRFTNTLSNTKTYQNIANSLKPVWEINTTGEVLICLSNQKNDSLHYTVITKDSLPIFQTDSLKNYKEETLKYKNYNIIKSQLNTHLFYSTVIDSTLVLSSSKDIITQMYNSEKKPSTFKKLYAVSGENENLSILASTNNALLPSFFKEESLSSNAICDFITLDTEITQDDIFINGIAKSADSSKKVLDLFKHTIPQENQTQHITPGNSDGYLSFTFNDFKVLQDNILNFHGKDSINPTETLFNSVVEVGVIYEDERRALVLNSIDVIATQDALLSEQNKITTYRDIDIFEFSKPEIFKIAFAPLISYSEFSMYCFIENYVVFANSVEQLQNIIANYQNKTTLGNKAYYKELSTHLSSESSLLLVAKPHLLKTIFDDYFEENTKLNFNAYQLGAIQFIYDTNFAHVHGGIIKGKTLKAQHSISESFNLKLNFDVLSNPQFVTNHVTKEKDIVVQDMNNNLYLISNKGKILWKKRLNGAIIGNISQIDMYKNGRLQLAFTTPNRLYVIDRKGRDVAPFPLKFNDKITQPLSVFDYDKNKNYRLIVTQGKHVLMYDARGKSVTGFTFKSANNNIISQPEHFRIGSKDYIVLKTKRKLYILNRVGKPRVTPKSNHTFSNEPVFLYQNKFTTTTDSGELVSIDTRGNVSTVNLGLTTSHNLETTSKTRVTFHDNQLGIKSRVLELDYGNYTRPRIFYINDKIYVTITDLQANKIHLYDSQGKSLPNFPVYGNSSIDLNQIDSDRNLEFVTKGDNNSIILYQIN